MPGYDEASRWDGADKGQRIISSGASVTGYDRQSFLGVDYGDIVPGYDEAFCWDGMGKDQRIINSGASVTCYDRQSFLCVDHGNIVLGYDEASRWDGMGKGSVSSVPVRLSLAMIGSALSVWITEISCRAMMRRFVGTERVWVSVSSVPVRLSLPMIGSAL